MSVRVFLVLFCGSQVKRSKAMVRTVGRLGWLAAAVLAGCVVSAGLCQAQDDDEATQRAAFDKGMELYTKGQLREAVPYLQKALELAPRVYGQDHENVASCCANLANLYRAMGQYAKAEPLYLRCLQIRENTGQDTPAVAQSLNNLALLYDDMGQYAQAEPLLQRGLKIYEDKLGKDHLDVAWNLNNLATLYWNMGHIEMAEPLLRRSLQIREDKLGKDHLDVAVTLNNLGLLYDDMDQYAKAEPL
jgi:tetratricopeptide (TPR) repeat protein